MKLKDGPGFRITNGKGFQVTFENGWTVSVQFGPGNYCSGYPGNLIAAGVEDYREKERKAGEQGNPLAEVWSWNKDGAAEIACRGYCESECYCREDVHSYQTPAEVLAYMVKVSQR